MRKNKIFWNYFKLFLCFLPGLIAGIEYTVFWWKNNGLHTSRYDFLIAHPGHTAISTIVLLISLILICRLKED